MLYPTLSQPLVFLVVLCAGIVGGLIFDIFRLLAFLSGNDKYSKTFFDFFATILSVFLCFYINLQINYGQFRIFVVLTFVFGILAEQLLSKILFTKYKKKWYNKLKERKNARRKKEKDN